MPTQRKSCLDNPNLPPKALRDILAKRRKRQKDKIKEKLTPALLQAFADYRQAGQKMAMSTVEVRQSELASALEMALDGAYDGSVQCDYCSFEQREHDRERMMEEKGESEVRSFSAPQRLPAPRLDEHAHCSRPLLSALLADVREEDAELRTPHFVHEHRPAAHRSA